jgi:predicted acyl esterase
MRQSTDRRVVRPVGRAAAAVSKMLTRAWSLPPQRNFVAVERNPQVPMSDGTVLLADHYLPVTSRPAATVLVRCPYGRGMPFSLLEAQLVAERGNPGNGQVEAPAKDFVVTHYSVRHPSALVVSQTEAKAAAHA